MTTNSEAYELYINTMNKNIMRGCLKFKKVIIFIIIITAHTNARIISPNDPFEIYVRSKYLVNQNYKIGLLQYPYDSIDFILFWSLYFTHKTHFSLNLLSGAYSQK